MLHYAFGFKWLYLWTALISKHELSSIGNAVFCSNTKLKSLRIMFPKSHNKILKKPNANGRCKYDLLSINGLYQNEWMPSCQKSRCTELSKGFQNTFVSLKLTVQLLNFHTQAFKVRRYLLTCVFERERN